MNSTAIINRIMKNNGFMKASSKAAAMGRASSGMRIITSDGYEIAEDRDGFTAIAFTTDELATKRNCTILQEAFADAGFRARVKVASMNRAEETFTYYLQVKAS